MVFMVEWHQFAEGFVPIDGCPSPSRRLTTGSCHQLGIQHGAELPSRQRATQLMDALFEEMFESENDCGSDSASKTTQQYNDDAIPFSSDESEQDRARRMEMVRSLQKTYYTPSETDAEMSLSGASSSDEYGSASLRSLPTLTSYDTINMPSVNNAAILPGYQFIWSIHLPHHSHMFHSILSQPPPWYFVHVALPSVSSSKGKAHSSSSDSKEGSKEDVVVNNIEAYTTIEKELNTNSFHLYGTLLRITDRRFQDEDGRIVLAVQAIDRVRVQRLASLPGNSAMVLTDVELWPEEELVRYYFDKALMSSASFLSTIDSDNENGGTERLSSPHAVAGAARSATSAEGRRCRTFEYRPILLEEKPTRRANNPNVLQTSAAKEVHQEGEHESDFLNVVQLINYDAFSFASLEDSLTVTSNTLTSYWNSLALDLSSQNDCESEDDFCDTKSEPMSTQTIMSHSTKSAFLSSSSSSASPSSIEGVEMMEYHLWRTLDEMIRLLAIASSATVPLPSQLLGLLPKRNDWPRDFVLEDYAKSLATSGSSIGTAFKSPFVRVDQITQSKHNATAISYSPLRRALRLSYSIWLLLDGLQMTGAQPPPPPRSVILGMESIWQRLNSAKETLDGINGILKRIVPDNRESGS